MTNSYAITGAATLIAEFDPAFAALFLRAPFARETIVTAFLPELTRTIGADLANRVAATVRECIATDRALREG